VTASTDAIRALVARVGTWLPTAARTALERLPSTCPPGGRGWAAAAAGMLEASAPKPGNVHPDASFPDLAYADFVAAAAATAPFFEAAPSQPLGRTIHDAVTASRGVTRSNANLGIVLLVAPLAAADAGPPLSPASVARVLSRRSPADAADIYAAIALAAPGGLGAVARWDVHAPPPADILAAMHDARDRDQIARLWALGYEPLFRGPVRDLRDEIAGGAPWGDAIVRAYVRHLAREPDSLVARRHGSATAATLSARAAAVLAAGDGWREAAVELDRDLRSPRRLAAATTCRRPAGAACSHADPAAAAGGIGAGNTNPRTVNPGTTADLIAAAMYIVLREAARADRPPA